MRDSTFIAKLDEIIRLCKEQIEKLTHATRLLGRVFPDDNDTDNSNEKADRNGDMQRVSPSGNSYDKPPKYRPYGKKGFWEGFGVAELIQAIIGVLIFSTLIYSIRSVHQSRDQFIQDHRPYIWKTGVSYARVAPDPHQSQLMVMVAFANFGRSPGIKMSDRGKVFCGQFAEEEANSYESRLIADDTWRNASVVLPPFVPEDWKNSAAQSDFISDPLDAASLKACLEYRLPVVTIGVVDYYDLVGNHYTGEFCMMQGIDTGRGYKGGNTCPVHNRTD
jgi:hypothetical protein